MPPLTPSAPRHHNYGVQDIHYEIVGKALLNTLEEALTAQKLWDEETKAQWAIVWGAVEATMKAGMAEGKAEAEAK